jgi:thiazole synthase
MSTLLQLSPSTWADEDPLVLYGQPLPSRLMLGTARYPSPAILEQAVARAQPCLLTVSLRRQGALGQKLPRGSGLCCRRWGSQFCPTPPVVTACRR